MQPKGLWQNRVWDIVAVQRSWLTRHSAHHLRACSKALCCLRSQVLDLSAIGAQAIARVERAQRAARDQLAAAMNQRPRLALKLELEGPKVAVPVPGNGEEGARRCTA